MTTLTVLLLDLTLTSEVLAAGKEAFESSTAAHCFGLGATHVTSAQTS